VRRGADSSVPGPVESTNRDERIQQKTGKGVGDRKRRWRVEGMNASREVANGELVRLWLVIGIGRDRLYELMRTVNILVYGLGC
jgi:hypothetical protein